MIRYEELLRRSAERDPDRIALVAQGKRTSYAELHAESERFAAGLVDHAHLRNGERCVLFIDNRLEAAIGIFGTLRAGGVFSVINPTTKADKLAYAAARKAEKKITGR